MESQQRTGEGRGLRFFLWNDMHIRCPEMLSEWPPYAFANEKASWMVDCSLGRQGFEPPDFILSAGDIIEGGNDDHGRDFQYLKTLILDRIRVPFLPCLGNHENKEGEGIPEKNRPYDASFGPLWHNYIFTAGGFGFIVIDTSASERAPDAITAVRRAFLERALVRLKGMPLLVVTHAPLIPVRDPAVLAKSFGFPSWKVQDTGLLELVEENRDRIVAVFSGHLHLTGIRERAGIYHVVPAGTSGYPSDFATVDVFTDRIEVKMHPLPAPWQPKESDIHARPRHEVDYTDAEHPDHESYVWGNAGERGVTIPLFSAKRPTRETERAGLSVFHETKANCWEQVR
jgi:hypothetical protein